MGKSDAIELRPPPPVMRIRGENDARTFFITAETKRPRTNRKLVVANMVDIGIFGEQMFGQNRIARSAHGEEHGDERCESVPEVDDDRMIV